MDYNKISLNRLLKFWVRRAEEQFVIVFGVVIVFYLYAAFLVSSDRVLHRIPESFPLILALVGVTMIWMYTLSTITSVAGIAISFGSTKKEMYIGQMTEFIIYLTQTAIIYFLLLLLFGKLSEPLYIFIGVAFIGGSLFLYGLNQIGGMINIKYGTKAFALYIAFTAIIIAALIILSIFIYNTGDLGSMFSFYMGTAPNTLEGNGSALYTLKPVIVGVGVLVCIVGSGIYYRSLKLFDVNG